VVGTFVRLKLRLLRNGLTLRQGATLFALGLIGAGVLATSGFAILAGSRTSVDAPDIAIVVFGLATLGWAIFPVLGFGTDETLDPQRLATLPLTRRQLVTGVFAASLVGVAPLATLVALSGALVGLTHSVASFVLIAAAVVLSLLLCVVASRTIVAVMVPILRSRRGRDFTILAMTLLALTPPLFELFATRHTDGSDFHETVVEVADRVRYTPFAWGGAAAADASAGKYASAVLLLVAVGASIGLLLWIWSRSLERALTTADPPASTATRGRASALIPALLPFLPHNRIGAVAAKDFRYFGRDPRRRAPLIGAMIVPAVALFASFSRNTDQPAATTLLGLIAVLPAAGLTLNQFGLDGAALWSSVAAGNDPRADLTGKNLASLLVMVPLAGVSAVICAAFADGWAYLPLTLGLAPAIFGVLLGVGDVVSVRAPYAMPDRRSPLAFNPGQGCASMLAGLGALAVQGILIFPMALLTVVLVNTRPLAVATVVALIVANAYGAFIWVCGRNLAARDVWWRLPELLDAVSPRQAG
jgi:ABC-2 type transport system permease protein